MLKSPSFVFLILIAPINPASLASAQGGIEYNAPPDHIDHCEEKLKTAGIHFKSIQLPLKKVRKQKGRPPIQCGTDQAIRYLKGPEGIRYSSTPKTSCGLALAMAKLEKIAQEEAQKYLKRRIIQIEHSGTYACREIKAYPGWVSEHAYANAIDIRGFKLKGGKTVTVLKHYGDPKAIPERPAAKFLRALAERLYDEKVFSIVLTPAFNRAHRNHMHLDLAHYRVDGIRFADN